MGFWSNVIGGVTAGAVKTVVDSGANASKVVWGDKAERDRLAAQSDMMAMSANSQVFIPPPYIPPNSSIFYTMLMWSLFVIRAALDVLVWGARPAILLMLSYVLFWWPYENPEGYAIYMKALSLTPSPILSFGLGALSGFLGLRTLTKEVIPYIIKKGIAGPKLSDAKEISAMKEELRIEKNRNKEYETILFDTEPNQTIGLGKR